MRVQITVKQQNHDFKKEYAEQYHFGKGSHGNWKDRWSEGFDFVKMIDNIHIFKDTVYEFLLENGETIKLNNVNVLSASKEDEIISRFIISKSIIKRMLKPPLRKSSDAQRYYFYQKPNKSVWRLSNNIYLNKEEVPPALMIEEI